MGFVYKIAETTSEFEQIHRLNYETFVEEIPQHGKNELHSLVDKFHDENTYIICLKDEKVIGMSAVRSQRPFSLDGKIGKVESYFTHTIENPVEIRLLSIEKNYRNGRAFMGLAQALVQYCLKAGYDAAFISGTVREQKLYNHLGFVPFAELTGNEEAAFQPMYLTRKTFDEGIAGKLAKPLINFLPGPVTISKEVQQTIMMQPFSHRSSQFNSILNRVKAKLTSLTLAKDVQILHGTGTLANDVIAGQLKVRGGKGLILVNGEFGSRLTDHATRFGLDFETLEAEWGKGFDKQQLGIQLSTNSYDWLWAVQSETSTGVLNDIEMLKEACSEDNIALVVDCISAIGVVPVNLQGVLFASGVSGKGLMSYTGISFVFHNEEVLPNETLPRYLDLGTYVKANGIPYSQSSNLLSALDTALQKYGNPSEIYDLVFERAKKIRTSLEEISFSVLADEKVATPAILTIQMPENMSVKKLGDNLFMNGFHVHYESDYLKKRNLFQIACLNHVTEKDLYNMLSVLRILSSTHIK
ncbi:aminotransferase class V-fold PLP-dependent enzyme [Sporosarcina sp. CAU 1771]